MGTSIGGFLVFAYAIACIAVTIYIITLIARFVGAHERVSAALETIARKHPDGKQ
jgi:hypothetical protein